MNRKPCISLSAANRALIAPMAIALLLGCSSNNLSDGNGSGTGTGNGTVMAMGRVIYANDKPVENAVVRLRPQSFLADTSGLSAPDINGNATSQTDEEGYFYFDSLDTRYSYSVEVNDGDEEGTLYRFAIGASDTVVLPTHIAAPMTDLVGTILLSGLPQKAYILIYGLERVGRTDSLGNFEIYELPAGDCQQGECEYRLQVISLLSDGSSKANEYELEITSDVAGNILKIELELENSPD